MIETDIAITDEKGNFVSEEEVDLENNRPNAYISLLYLYVSVL